MYLVEFKTNYAEEFDVYGFAIWDRQHLEEFNEACDKVRNRGKLDNEDFYINYYFGNNELEFDSPEHVFRSFKVTELQDFEVRILLNSFKMQVNDRKGLFFELTDRVCDWEYENEYNEE